MYILRKDIMSPKTPVMLLLDPIESTGCWAAFGVDNAGTIRDSDSKQALTGDLAWVPNTQRQIVRIGIDNAVPCCGIVMIHLDGARRCAIGHRIVLHCARIVAHLDQELGCSERQGTGRRESEIVYRIHSR
jgi:hypothetical protein